MVMGRDSRSKSCGFESRHRMLDGHFFTYICCKICLEKPKINEKAAGVGPFKKKLFNRGSGCGSVGRVVASDCRGLRFEISHRQNFYKPPVNCVEKT